jgi:tetraacyldisaccharide 4'-kinase
MSRAVRRARLVQAWQEGLPRGARVMLAPATWAYRALLAAREAAFARGLLSRGRLPCPVVSVGNLTVGGTGKTPVVECVARWLQEDGFRVAVVSRGYGRRGAPVELVSDGGGPLVDAERAGDEPVLLARRVPGLVVVVGADRVAAGRWAVERVGAGVVVLDDGFQQRRLAKDVEVVCLDARAPWGRGGLFPAGTLREPPGALARAHLLVLTHAGQGRDAVRLAADVRALARGAPCVTADYRLDAVVDAATGAVHGVEALRGRPVLAFAGIAVPGGLDATLGAAGATVRDLVGFPDHHRYRAGDGALLARRARAAGAEVLVTTEKDAVRLGPLLGVVGALPPVWIARVRLDLGGDVEAWRAALRSRVVAARGRQGEGG